MTIHRYMKRGILYPVYKGLYATRPVHLVDPRLLGMSIIHRYAYLSCETVLSDEGIIMQIPNGYTFISGMSKTVTVGDTIFHYRQLHDRYLFHPAGIVERDGIRIATPARAVADQLYFNPRYYFDMHAMIDWKAVKALQKEIGYV